VAAALQLRLHQVRPELIENHKVIAWTPYGRRNTVSILVEYVRRDVERGLIDEYWLYLNVGKGQDADVEYMHELDRTYDWIRIVERPEDCRHRKPIQRNTGYAYRYMTDPNAIYMRLDDDIIYIHEDTVERLVRAKIERPMVTACFPMIWNNAVCTYFGQTQGVIPTEWGEAKPWCMDAVGWANGKFAVQMHEYLLDHIERDAVDELFLYHDPSLEIGQQFSVSCFTSSGEMYANLPDGPGVLVPDEEESWHTIFRTKTTGVPNIIIGDALVSHYSFFPQRSILWKTDVLDRYRELAAKLNT